MRNKILLTTLCAISAYSGTAFANRMAFQQFDNQYNVGYAYNNLSIQNGANKNAEISSQSLNLNLERLFNNGVWMNIATSMNLDTNTNQIGSYGGQINGNQPFLTQDPNYISANAKVGYAFEVVSNHLQIIPYAFLGRNSNFAASSIAYNNNSNITQYAYFNLGLGSKLEYRINRNIDLYLDELMAYNFDLSNPSMNISTLHTGVPQDNINFKTVIGAKFNVVKNLQLGVNAFYNNIVSQANAPVDLQGVSVYTPRYLLGGMLTVGLTY